MKLVHTPSIETIFVGQVSQLVKSLEPYDEANAKLYYDQIVRLLQEQPFTKKEYSYYMGQLDFIVNSGKYIYPYIIGS